MHSQKQKKPLLVTKQISEDEQYLNLLSQTKRNLSHGIARNLLTTRFDYGNDLRTTEANRRNLKKTSSNVSKSCQNKSSITKISELNSLIPLATVTCSNQNHNINMKDNSAIEVTDINTMDTINETLNESHRNCSTNNFFECVTEADKNQIKTLKRAEKTKKEENAEPQSENKYAPNGPTTKIIYNIIYNTYYRFTYKLLVWYVLCV